MWAYKLNGPGFVSQYERPDDNRELGPGQVRLRFKAAGLCGSDMPKLNGIIVRKGTPSNDYPPVHEMVGEVIESASNELSVGQRVVGSGGGRNGLAFCHVLKHRGAAHLTSVDPVDRDAVARHFSADDFVQLRSTQWAETLTDESRPEIVVEAVGHQHATITDALRAVAEQGFVYGFGSPDDPDYVIPYQQVYERSLTLRAGRTLGGWLEVLRDGRDYLLRHREDFKGYISHEIPVSDAQTAYSLYARPQAGRLKVAIVD